MKGYHVRLDGGNVWMWGTNEYGQLGTPDDDIVMLSKPSKLQISEEDR